MMECMERFGLPAVGPKQIAGGNRMLENIFVIIIVGGACALCVRALVRFFRGGKSACSCDNPCCPGAGSGQGSDVSLQTELHDLTKDVSGPPDRKPVEN